MQETKTVEYYIRIKPDKRVKSGARLVEWKTKGRKWTPYANAPERLTTHPKLAPAVSEYIRKAERDESDCVVTLKVTVRITRQGSWKRRVSQAAKGGKEQV